MAPLPTADKATWGIAVKITGSTVTIAGHRLAYLRAGDGPPLLLIHGIPTYSYLWRDVIPGLAHAHTVYAVDLLGYGDSDQPAEADLSLPAQARYLDELLRQIGWTTGTVVGHDIGGGVAQLLAVADPRRVERLVLVDTVTYDSWPVPDIARLKDPAWDGIMERLELAKGLTKGLTRGMVRKERVTPELIAAYERPFAGVEGRRAYLRCARALRTEDLLAAMPEVERLPLPTLIVWGERDEFQDVAYGRRLAAAMPAATLRVLPGAGHFLPEDQPEELARVIAEFARAGAPRG